MAVALDEVRPRRRRLDRLENLFLLPGPAQTPQSSREVPSNLRLARLRSQRLHKDLFALVIQLSAQGPVKATADARGCGWG